MKPNSPKHMLGLNLILLVIQVIMYSQTNDKFWLILGLYSVAMIAFSLYHLKRLG